MSELRIEAGEATENPRLRRLSGRLLPCRGHCVTSITTGEAYFFFLPPFRRRLLRSSIGSSFHEDLARPFDRRLPRRLTTALACLIAEASDAPRDKALSATADHCRFAFWLHAFFVNPLALALLHGMRHQKKRSPALGPRGPKHQAYQVIALCASRRTSRPRTAQPFNSGNDSRTRICQNCNSATIRYNRQARQGVCCTSRSMTVHSTRSK